MKKNKWSHLVIDTSLNLTSSALSESKRKYTPNKSCDNHKVNFQGNSSQIRQKRQKKPLVKSQNLQEESESFCLDFIKRQKTPQQEIMSPTKNNHVKIIPLTSKMSAKRISASNSPLNKINTEIVHSKISKLQREFELFKSIIFDELKHQQQFLQRTVIGFLEEVNQNVSSINQQKYVPVSLEPIKCMFQEFSEILSNKFNRTKSSYQFNQTNQIDKTNKANCAFRLINIEQTVSHHDSQASRSQKKYRQSHPRLLQNYPSKSKQRKPNPVKKQNQFSKLFSVMNKLKQDINGLTDIRTRNHTHAF